MVGGWWGEGEAGKTGPAPWAVPESRPRSLAAAVERFRGEFSASEAAQLEAVVLSLKPREGGRRDFLYSFETQYQSFRVLGSFRADTVPDVAVVILGGLPLFFTSGLFWSIDHASH